MFVFARDLRRWSCSKIHSKSSEDDDDRVEPSSIFRSFESVAVVERGGRFLDQSTMFVRGDGVKRRHAKILASVRGSTLLAASSQFSPAARQHCYSRWQCRLSQVQNAASSVACALPARRQYVGVLQAASVHLLRFRDLASCQFDAFVALQRDRLSDPERDGEKNNKLQ